MYKLLHLPSSGILLQHKEVVGESSHAYVQSFFTDLYAVILSSETAEGVNETSENFFDDFDFNDFIPMKFKSKRAARLFLYRLIENTIIFGYFSPKKQRMSPQSAAQKVYCEYTKGGFFIKRHQYFSCMTFNPHKKITKLELLSEWEVIED